MSLTLDQGRHELVPQQCESMVSRRFSLGQGGRRVALCPYLFLLINTFVLLPCLLLLYAYPLILFTCCVFVLFTCFAVVKSLQFCVTFYASDFLIIWKKNNKSEAADIFGEHTAEEGGQEALQKLTALVK